MTTELFTRPALTTLSEDEEDFREVIRNFAEEVHRPKVEEMDRNAKMDPEIIEALFENGLMSIEIPEEYEGQGGSFFMAILAVEELARVDPSVAVLQDVQGHPLNVRHAAARGVLLFLNGKHS